MWKLCVVDDESNRTDVDLVRAEYSLGRAEESTVRLTERNISRNHARLFHDEEHQWWLEDKDSYTGSFVNGERIAERAALQHGDTVQLGDYRLEMTDTRQDEASVSDSAQQAKSLVDRLTIVQGPGVGTVHELTEQKLLIGRGEECKIALDDASVSRVHVEVLRTEHGLMILDQGSSNGLRINGADLPSAMLRSGDVVELGDVRLKFTPAGTEDLDSPAQASAAEVPSEGGSAAEAGGGRSFLPYAAGVAALGVLFFLLVGGEEDVPTVATTRMGIEGGNAIAEVGGPEAVLKEAQKLAAQGSGVLAHRKLRDIPANSELRSSQEFLDIEKQWADELLKAAAESPDREERRAFLRRVSQTPGVGSERRTRAARKLAALEAESELKVVDVSELPTAKSSRKPSQSAETDSGKAASAKPAAAKKTAVAKRKASAVVKPKRSGGKTGSVPKTATQTAAPAKTEPKPSPKKTVPKKPVVKKAISKKPEPVAPKPKAPTSSPPELIRDNPF